PQGPEKSQRFPLATGLERVGSAGELLLRPLGVAPRETRQLLAGFRRLDPAPATRRRNRLSPRARPLRRRFAAHRAAARLGRRLVRFDPWPVLPARVLPPALRGVAAVGVARRALAPLVSAFVHEASFPRETRQVSALSALRHAATRPTRP